MGVVVEKITRFFITWLTFFESSQLLHQYKKNFISTIDKALIPITKIKTEGSKNGVEIYSPVKHSR